VDLCTYMHQWPITAGNCTVFNIVFSMMY